MSRALPWVLLLLAVGVGIGLSLLLLAPPRAPGAGPMHTAAVRGGVPQGHVYTGVAEEPGDFNPFTTTSALARTYVLGFTHDTLFDTDPVSGAARPMLATGYELAADGMAMTVTLREGVQFADGTPMTIDDVLFSFAVAQCEDVVLTSMAEGMHLVRAVERLPGEPARLRVTFARHYFAAARIVGENWLVVQKRWWLDRIAEQARRDQVPVPAPGQPGFGALLTKVTESPGPGTGPYMFHGDAAERPSWRRGSDLTLPQNPHSWQRAAQPGTWNLAAIRFLFVHDAAARHALLLQRQLDWYSAPDLSALLAREPELARDYRRLVYDRPTLGLYTVQWNTQRPQLADPRVRRALGMLFDREQIVRTVLGGSGRPAVAFAKPDHPGYPRDRAPVACDPPAARRLLREAGFAPEDGRPLRVSLLVPAEVPWYRQMAELAASAARAAGVELELEVLLLKELMERRRGDRWDGALVLVSMSAYGDPYELFHSQGSRNAGHWHDAVADELLDAQRVATDPAARGDLLARFHARMDEQQPMAVLVQPLADVLVDARLQGVAVGPLGLWPERFWMPTESQR